MNLKYFKSDTVCNFLIKIYLLVYPNSIIKDLFVKLCMFFSIYLLILLEDLILKNYNGKYFYFILFLIVCIYFISFSVAFRNIIKGLSLVTTYESGVGVYYIFIGLAWGILTFFGLLFSYGLAF